MKNKINEAFQVSPFLVLILVNSIQVGVGILGFQRNLIEKTGNDSWIAVLFAGLAVHLIIWVMYMLLNRAKGDLVEIHRELFGKWLGALISLIWIVYFTMIGLSVLFSYFEVIRVWMFPDISVLLLTFIFVLLAYYTVSGGFRIVTGIAFLGTIIPAYLIFTLFYPLQYTNFVSLLPIWNHSIQEITLGTHEMTLSYLGFSTLLMYYPFIKKAKTSQKWAHIGALLTMFIYVLITVISIGYFSEKQIIRHMWATLSLWKVVELPFVARFEYIGITSWALVILPNVCIAFWAASRGLKQIFQVKQRYLLLIILAVVLFSNFYFKERQRIEMLTKWTSEIGFYLTFIYIPLLLLIYLLITKLRRKRK